MIGVLSDPDSLADDLASARAAAVYNSFISSLPDIVGGDLAAEAKRLTGGPLGPNATPAEVRVACHALLRWSGALLYQNQEGSRPALEQTSNAGGAPLMNSAASGMYL